MRPEILEFLRGDPARIALFEAAEAAVLDCGPSQLTAAKTQLSWGNPRKFAFLSFPRRAGQAGLVLSFGLERRLGHPKIAQMANPYPDRWTHHVFLQKPEDLDEDVRIWLKEAYLFAKNKKRCK